MVARTRLLVVDDHPMVRAGLVSILGAEAAFVVVGTAGSYAEADAVASVQRPDLAVVDLRLPDRSGQELIAAWARARPGLRCLAMSSLARGEAVRAAVDAGARGFILKEASPEDVRAAVRIVAAGGRWFATEAARSLAEAGPRSDLTPRELAVLERLGAGMTSRQIGDALGIAEGTVSVHVQAVLAKLGASNRSSAVAVAHERGIIDVGDLPRTR